MIRRGKAEGWLSADPAALKRLTTSFGVNFGPCDVVHIEGKGAALVSSETLANDCADEKLLLSVPRDLVLSKENVLLQAKSDRHLRQVLEAAGDWGMITHSCPTVTERIGLSGPFSEYVKSLPLEDLPSSWTEDELALTAGTTLHPATNAKLNSLYREYDQLRAATSSIPWCEREWWDDVDGILEFDDWRQVDAMYRSRALELPGIGDCMIPCVDIANHASGDQTIARYESMSDGEACLLLRQGQALSLGQEITITYGDNKGACEMAFSYGFIESSAESANTLFLDIAIDDDDPLKKAKQYVADSAPGVRLSETPSGIEWDSDYVLLALVNEEDGLQFQVLQTVDGEQDLQMSWQGEPIKNATELRDRLKMNELWAVVELRAVITIQNRVNEQVHALQQSGYGVSDSVRAGPGMVAQRLRDLEGLLLERSLKHLQQEAQRLAEHPVVQRYLTQLQSGPRPNDDEEDDFS